MHELGMSTWRLGPVIGIGIGITVALASATACTGGGPPAATTATTSTEVGTTEVGSTAPAPIPDQYRDQYDRLAQRLDEYSSTLAEHPPVASTAPVQATELLSANGNRLRALLGPDAIQGVDRELDALQQLGIGGVTLGIKLPMLDPELEPDAPRYAQFYADVADHARARGMTVDVELGALFCGTVFADCSYTWPTAVSDFAAITATQADAVIARVRPDYLTILAEPTTEGQLTGIHGLDTPEGADDYVRQTLALMGDRGATKVGAGAGTWSPTTFAQRLVAEPIDYLDTHVYPVGPNIAETLETMATIAHDAGKPLVIDELWLYKTDAPAGANGVALAAGENQLNQFSFWQPLDVDFLSATERWAASAGVVYESAFRSTNLFTYLTWTPQLDAASFAASSAAFNRQAVAALSAGTATE
ncbi:MAG: hypothetical protein ACXV8G_10815, partial [Acidimicrobiales bacterium]